MLDARRLEPVPVPARVARRLALQGRALRVRRRAQHRHLRRRRAGRSELAELRAEAKRAQPRTGLARPRRVRGRRRSPRSSRSRRTRLLALRRVRRPVRAAPVRAAACTSTSASRAPRRACSALEGVLPWLPLVLALSANSPYLAGAETGLASTRAEILALLPRSGAPPVFASYEEWEQFAERLLALGLADAYTRIWWDVRPHPRFGTLEVRHAGPADASRRDRRVRALVQALVASASGQARRPIAGSTRRTAGRRSLRTCGRAHPSGRTASPAWTSCSVSCSNARAAADRLGGRRVPRTAPRVSLRRTTNSRSDAARARALCERLVSAHV